MIFNIQNLSIKKTLFSCAIMGVLFSATLVGIGIFSNSHMESIQKKFITTTIPLESHSNKLGAILTDLFLRQNEYLSCERFIDLKSLSSKEILITDFKQEITFLNDIKGITDKRYKETLKAIQNIFLTFISNDDVLFKIKKSTIENKDYGNSKLESLKNLKNTSRKLMHELQDQLAKLSEFSTTINSNILVESKKVVNTSRLLQIVAGIFIILSIIMFAYFIIIKFSEPIQKSLKTVEQISKGNLKVSVNYQGKDEMGILAKNINIMIKSLNDVVSNVKDSASEIATISGEMSGSSSSMLNNVWEQNQKSSFITDVSKDFSENANIIKEKAEQIFTFAEKTKIFVTAGEKVIQRSNDEVSEIESKVKETEKQIVKLNDYSSEIGSITNVISDIVDKTDMLALNAAIEAARAGRYGLGFGIVSDEIKKLAEQTDKSTEKINQMISNIQLEIINTMQSMDIVSKIVQDSVKHSNETADVLKKVIQNIDSFLEMSTQITGFAKSMATITEQVNSELNAVSDSSKNTYGEAEKISNVASYLTDLSNKLKGITEKFQN